MSGTDLIKGRISDDDIEKMRRRIGYPNPTLRKGILAKPWNPTATADSFGRWAQSIGDDNPFYCEPEYATKTRWAGAIAPPGFEWSMGYDLSRQVPEDLFNETRGALRGVQLYHSGAEYFYYRPIFDGVMLYKAECVSDVVGKVNKAAKRSVIVDNVTCWWDREKQIYTKNSRYFVHIERTPATNEIKAKEPLANYSEEDLAEIEAAYDNEYQRGADKLFIEDISVGQATPVMVKGPLTITDLINLHMGTGWMTYGNPPFRLAYENRKRLKGFYSRNEYNAWDTIQRVHWDVGMAHAVGVSHVYDYGPLRYIMLCHYLSNFAGDDGWVYRIQYELRAFNYIGDTTWISGTIIDVRIDETLGPLIELDIRGKNQRGQENIKASATILIASRERGLPKLPPAPQLEDVITL